MAGQQVTPELVKLIAKVIATEGCDCCRGRDHKALQDELARALNVPPYSDGSGYQWYAVAKGEQGE